MMGGVFLRINFFRVNIMANAQTIWVVTDTSANSLNNHNHNGLNGVRSINDPYSGEWDDNSQAGAMSLSKLNATKGISDAVPISAEKLEQEMTSFLQVVGRVFEKADDKAATSGMELDEVQLSVEISGEGEVKLLGSGAKAAGKGAITLTFRRR
jgi:hypothetical protein